MSKFKELKSVIHSPAGPLKVINLMRFINLVNITTVSGDHSKVMAVCEGKRYGQSSEGELRFWQEDHINIPVHLIPMGYNYKNRLDVLRYFLMEQSSMRDIPNTNLDEMIYDASQLHLYEYGNPTHLVRVAPRLWMVANPEDFVIFMNPDNHKIGMLVKDEKKTKIYSVHYGQPKTFKILGQN